MATAAGVLSSVGGIGNQVADASFKATDWRNQQAEEKLKLLQAGIQLQTLQEKLRQTKQPASIGRMQLPNGKVIEIIQDPQTGEIKTQDLYSGPDPAAMTTSVKELLDSMGPDDEEGKKAGQAIYNGLLASTGDPQQAMAGLTTFVKQVTGNDLKADQKMQDVQRRLLEGQQLGLTGGDLTAYAMGVTGATGYSFTPAGKRANRPSGTGTGAADDNSAIATMAQDVAKGTPLSAIPMKDRPKVMQYMAQNSMGIPGKQDALTTRQVHDEKVLSDQLDTYTKILEDAKLDDENISGYFAPYRLQYSMGHANKYTDLINQVERFKVTSMKSLTTSRNMRMIDMIQIHLPNFWVDSPKTIYKKMLDIQDLLNRDIKEKSSSASGIIPDEGGGATGTPGASPEVITVTPEDLKGGK